MSARTVMHTSCRILYPMQKDWLLRDSSVPPVRSIPARQPLRVPYDVLPFIFSLFAYFLSQLKHKRGCLRSSPLSTSLSCRQGLLELWRISVSCGLLCTI